MAQDQNQSEATTDDDRAVEAEVWSATDTRLANHYIQLLQKDPAYGNVLDLLWELYQKKEQTDLLIEYFKGAAESGEAPVAQLIYAHLLRKADRADEARDAYDAYLKLDPESIPTLKALAEIADSQKRFSKALSYYNRLVDHLPASSEDGVAVRLRKAILHQQQEQPDEAVAIWNELLRTHPGNTDLRTEIVSMLLEAGETSTATKVLRELTETDDPRQKLNALMELNRLYEFISNFDEAVDAARKGMALLHFKNHQHEELFSRLVRAHERFQKLPDLEKELKDRASGENPTEKSLYLLAEFYRLTANARAEEEALSRLVAILPADIDYRVHLAEVQMQNDRYEEAAATLDQVLENQPEIPLRLILLRARVALIDEQEVEAEQILLNYLKNGNDDPDTVKKIIDFARSLYLDSLVERLLRESNSGMIAGSDGESAPLDLARFLHERGRSDQAVETLNAYVDNAGDAATERARRLHQVATAFRELRLTEAALDAINEANELVPDRLEYITTRSNVLVDQKKIPEAVEALERIWDLQTGLKDKSETDQRIFSLLRGHFSGEEVDPDAGLLKQGQIQTLTQYRKMAAAATRSRRAGDAPPPEEITAYFQKIRKKANESPSVENRYRAAWWAFKLQDNSECYFQLTSAQEEAGTPVIEIEKMLLDLAEQNERPTLMARHLETLAKIDPENADDYSQKRAEVRFELGFEDEAVRELKRLAAKPEASLNVLSTLAKVYKLQGSHGKHIEVWQSAYRKANVFEKRRIIKQLTTALIESGNPEEALKAQLELIERETDLVQRRKQLDSQLTVGRSHFLLDWLRDRYTELAQKEPFDRFFPEALARIHQAAGNDREAFEAMKKAYYMSGQSESLLDELGELAGRLGDLSSAIYYRRQIIARSGGETTIENWQSLISMLEKDLRVGEADLLRKRLETKFGQNPEFLRDLARLYRSSGRLAAAERVLEKIVALRDWDVPGLLELALLKNENGRSEEALELFEKVIARTDDTELPAGSPELWPWIRVATLPPAIRNDDGRVLTDMAISVESFAFLGGEIQDEIADWLQKPHPEFNYLPTKEYSIRLRAIEEAGALHAAKGTSRKWMEQWDADKPVHEQLWAARHSNSREQLLGLLEELPVPEDSVSALSYCFARILAGDVDPAGYQLEESGSGIAESSYAILASFLLVKDLPGDPLLDLKNLETLLTRVEISPTFGSHIFGELRKSGDLDFAYHIGNILANTTMSETGDFLFALSQVADWTGREEEQAARLDQSLDHLISESGNRVAPHFLPAMTSKLSRLSNIDEKTNLISTTRSTIDAQENLPELVRMEKDVLLDLAAGNHFSAVSRLSEMAERQIDHIRPSVDEEDQLRYTQDRAWSLMEQLFLYYSERLHLDRETSHDFARAISGKPLALPVDDSVISQFEVFEMQRLTWPLEWMNLPERHATVQELYSLLIDPGSPLELGRILERRGFYRDAIPVYRAEALKTPDDYEPLRELFDSCLDALEPEPALQMIDLLNSREISAPPGLTVSYLNEQHARFLLIKRDIERLSQLGQAPVGRKGSPPIAGTSHIPYQKALIQAYRQTDNSDALIRLLSHLRNRGEISQKELLLGVSVLHEKGSYDTAREWLNDIPLDHTDSEIERKVMAALLELEKASGTPDKEELIRLARHSLEGSNSDFAATVATVLAGAGHTGDAVGILRLLQRNIPNAGMRTQIANQIIQLQLQAGTGVGDLAEDIAVLLNGVGEARGEIPAFIETMRESASDPEELALLLDRTELKPEVRWITSLLKANGEDNLFDVAVEIGEEPGHPPVETLLETLVAFGPVGEKAAADIVESSGKSGDHFFRNAPAKQIEFFSTIGDLPRLQEVHARLMREAESDIFHQRGLERSFPTLHHRHKIPELFSAHGHPELAAALFRKYHDTIRSYNWDHQVFLTSYLRFLIEHQYFDEAESVFLRLNRKSLRVDMRLMAQLYHDWGKLDQWEERTGPMYLSEGTKILLNEWSTALAEGREMVEYKISNW